MCLSHGISSQSHLLLSYGLGSLLEPVQEATMHALQVSHTTASRCASPLCLLAPIVSSLTGARVRASGASLLLNVVGLSPAPSAEGVSLVVPLTEARGTLCHLVALPRLNHVVSGSTAHAQKERCGQKCEQTSK